MSREDDRIEPMAMPDGFTIRRASTADLDTLVAHRRAMFHDMGYTDQAALDAMSAKFRGWLLERMNRGDYHAWLVDSPGGKVAAGAGLWLMDWPPHMIGHGARRGNILNVYTANNFRRQGLARRLMEAVAALVPREWNRYADFARQPRRQKSVRVTGICGYERNAASVVAGLGPRGAAAIGNDLQRWDEIPVMVRTYSFGRITAARCLISSAGLSATSFMYSVKVTKR